MLTVDQRQFKQELHSLIDAASGEKLVPEVFVGQIVALSQKHHIVIRSRELGSNICKLVMANNSQRAHKLVGALEDRNLSVRGYAFIAALKFTFKYGSIAAFVVGVMWAYNSCSGG